MAWNACADDTKQAEDGMERGGDDMERGGDMRSNSAIFLSLFGHIYHLLSLCITVWRPDGMGAEALLVIEVIAFFAKHTSARTRARGRTIYLRE